jgi:phosphatidylethanolamine-binding protein (PEBP) family uncharacterized protein
MCTDTKYALAALGLFCAVSMTSSLAHAEENMALTLTSTAFTQGGEIPSRYTCQGDDIAPRMEWQGIPANRQKSVVL